MKDVKFIVMTCDGREEMAQNVVKNVPNVIVNHDDYTNKGKFVSTAWYNYQRGWKLAGESATVQMDDDIIFTSNFMEKIEHAISQYPNDLIQFFSMRKKDIEIGTRREYGGNFMMQQCYYIPKGMAKEIYKHSLYYETITDDGGVPTDVCIQDYLKSVKTSYIIWCPNLVDHMVAVSAIDKRRSSKRQSKTFKK